MKKESLLLLFWLIGAGCTGHLSSKQVELAKSYGYPETKLLRLREVKPLRGCDKDNEFQQFFSRFRRFKLIENFITQKFCFLREKLQGKQSQHSLCRTKVIGKTNEKRPIYAIEILSNESAVSKSLLMLGGVHGREWITIPSVLSTALRLDLKGFNLLIIPILNPDGYEYSWRNERFKKVKYTKDGLLWETKSARLFRKNRRRNGDGTFGVDLNRNWGSSDGPNATWGINFNSHSITLSASDIYQGPSGFSEPETIAVRKYFKSHTDIVAVVDVHCCMGTILEPFSIHTPIKSVVSRIGERMVDAINTVSPPDEKYEYLRREESNEAASGLSSSYFFEEEKIDFVYVLETRGRFVMPCDNIRKIGKEVRIGVQALITELDMYKDNKMNMASELHDIGITEVVTDPIQMYSSYHLNNNCILVGIFGVFFRSYKNKTKTVS
eukprot:maker-scaffold_84-snap-gene-0.53-mRNA-1 protein AED:0.04 eAED:0.04 QI:114/0.66/0.5/1/1/1/4/0/438